MKKSILIFVLMLAALVGLFFLLGRHEKPLETGTDELLVYCAAGLQKPVREIASRYEKEYGTKIRLNFGGSGSLESQLKVAGGDLFIPADYSYIERTRAQGLVMESTSLAMLHAVIVVAKGNPKSIHSLDDLKKNGIRLSVAEPSAAAGKYVRSILALSGDWEGIKKRIVVTKPTVNNVIEDVAIGSVDAGLAWDAVALQFDKVEIVRVSVFESEPRRASVGVIKGASTPAALHFMRYLSAQEKGRAVFLEMGFAVPDKADIWADVPDLTIFAGSMLRVAIQDRLKLFEQREGCRIATTFEGCGTLVSMMKGGGFQPDGYFSCDITFLDMVQEKFQPGQIITGNEIVLLVPKNNPRKLTDINSLTRDNLKVGLSDPRKSALGKLSKDMLIKQGLWKNLNASGNIAVLVSKGDELVNQMQVGALDAALLYRSNAMASPRIMASCEIIDLNLPEAHATQPFAIAKEAAYPVLWSRLRDFLTNAEARESFEELGFTWRKETITHE
jgi:molybdenum ABC transporter molybdate-binding protein